MATDDVEPESSRDAEASTAGGADSSAGAPITRPSGARGPGPAAGSDVRLDPDEIDPATRAVDERDSVHPPGADREPTPEEELAAERAAPDDATMARAAAAYRDAAQHGVEQEGEGRID